MGGVPSDTILDRLPQPSLNVAVEYSRLRLRPCNLYERGPARVFNLRCCRHSATQFSGRSCRWNIAHLEGYLVATTFHPSVIVFRKFSNQMMPAPQRAQGTRCGRWASKDRARFQTLRFAPHVRITGGDGGRRPANACSFARAHKHSDDNALRSSS